MAIYINQESGLEKFANAALKGVQAGQQYRSNALQQQTQQNQLNEYDRTQQRRGALSRVAPGDYKGIAAAEMQFGEAGAANEALEKAKAQKKEQAFLALQSQDFDTATKLANEIHGTNYSFAGLTPDKKGLLLAAPDPQNPARVRKLQPLPTSDFIAGLLGVEKGATYGQKEREMSNASRNSAMLAGAYRNQKDELVGLSTANDAPVYKYGQGPDARLYTIGPGGKFVAYDERTMGRVKGLWNQKDAGGAQMGDAEALARGGLKPEEGMDAEGVKRRVGAIDTARAIDSARAKIKLNSSMSGADAAREIQSELMRNPKITREQVIAQGYDPIIVNSFFPAPQALRRP